MKILINCSTLKKGGSLQVAHSFVSELLKRLDHQYYFIFSSAIKNDLRDYDKIIGDKFFFYDVKPSVYLAITGKEKKLNQILSQVNPDIVFSIFGPTYWKPKCLHVCGYAKPSYFYPDSPFIKKLSLLRKIRLFSLKQLHLNDFKNFNDALITETNDAAQRLSKLLPSKKIFTVSNTYNQVYDNKSEWDVSIQLPEFKGITLLSITANYRHKNLDIIPEVIYHLKRKDPSFNFRFVLTLSKDELKQVDKDYIEHILFLGRVSIYQCPPLYTQSDLMFMPTLLECFSATYPEAMKMGVPILTSDLPFARDICGDAAIYFNPISPQSVAEAIYSLSTNKSMREELALRGRKRLLTFNTSKSRAQKYIKILETIYETDHTES